MATSVVVKPDGTTEINYNDNRTIRFAPGTDAGLTYPCPHAPTCRAFFYTQDDLNQHRIFDHAEIPKNLTPAPPQMPTKYFKRSSMYKMSAAVQKERLKHTLLVLGLDVEKIRKPIFKRIREWLNARRNRA
jgi:hypothetical protein